MADSGGVRIARGLKLAAEATQITNAIIAEHGGTDDSEHVKTAMIAWINRLPDKRQAIEDFEIAVMAIEMLKMLTQVYAILDLAKEEGDG